MSLAGKVAVVTGGGSGMGRATCVQLAKDGAAVAVWDWNLDGAQETVALIEAFGGSALGLKVDVSSNAEVAAAAKRTREALGPVTILVNNAGINGYDRFLEITDEEWDRIMNVNLKGPFYCTRAVIPDMIEAGWGRIVNVTSSSTQVGAPKMAHYAASKGGLSAFTKSLAAEFARNGITVNNVPPHMTDTPMLRAHRSDENIKLLAAEFLMGVPGQPEDIAAAVAFLCSPSAKHITGHTLGVNGGQYMN